MISEISLFVADDHPLLLKGLVDQLKEYNYNVIDTAENGAVALDKIIELQPSIAILDEEMPLLTGFEVIKKCIEKQSDTKFVILTSHKEKAFIYKAKKLNISGYIIKDEPFIEIHNCIQSISLGIPYFSALFNSLFDNEVAPQLEEAVHTLKGKPFVSDIRNCGAAAALTLEAVPGEPMKRPYEVAMKMWEKGFYVRYGGDTIQMALPFTTGQDEIDELITALGNSLKEVQ